MLALDCGEVLTDHGDAMARLASLVGVPEGAFAAKYWAERRPYDEGESNESYWGRVLAGFGKTADAELVQRLVDVDLGQWAKLRPAAGATLTRLAERGERMVLLSNASSAFRGYLEAEGWTDVFEALVISGEIGAVKPDPGMYEAAEQVAAGEPIRFLDDRQENVDAALARGWEAHLWTSDADAARWLLGEG